MNLFKLFCGNIFKTIYAACFLFLSFAAMPLFSAEYIFVNGGETLPGTNYSDNASYGMYNTGSVNNATTVAGDTVVNVNNNLIGMYINSGGEIQIKPDADTSSYTFNINNNTGSGIVAENNSSLSFTNANLNINNDILVNDAATGITVNSGSQVNITGKADAGNVLISSGNLYSVYANNGVFKATNININIAASRSADGLDGVGLYALNGGEAIISGNALTSFIANNNVYAVKADDASVNLTDTNFRMAGNRNMDDTSGAALSALGGGSVSISVTGTNFNSFEAYDNYTGIEAVGAGTTVSFTGMDVRSSSNTAQGINVLQGATVILTGRAAGTNLFFSTANVTGVNVSGADSAFTVTDMNVTLSSNSVSGVTVGSGGSALLGSANGNNVLTANNNLNGIEALENGSVTINNMNVNVIGNINGEAGAGAGISSSGIINYTGSAAVLNTLNANQNAYGLAALSGGEVTISSVAVNALNNALAGLYAYNGGELNVNGFGAAQTITASGSYFGFLSDGGDINITNMNVMAQGNDIGLKAVNEGSVTINAGGDTIVSANYSSSAGILASDGGAVNINNSDVYAVQTSSGIAAQQGGLVSITGNAQGTNNLVLGYNTVGIYAAGGGTVTVSGMNIIANDTYGGMHYGIFAQEGGSVNITGNAGGLSAIISTNVATAVSALGEGSKIEIINMNANFSDNSVAGLYSDSGGSVLFKGNMNGTTVFTSTGTAAAYATGANSKIEISNVDVYASSSAATGGSGFTANNGASLLFTNYTNTVKTLYADKNMINGIYADNGLVFSSSMNVVLTNHVYGSNQGTGLYASGGSNISFTGSADEDNIFISTGNVFGIRASGSNTNTAINNMDIIIAGNSNGAKNGGGGIYAESATVALDGGGKKTLQMYDNAVAGITLAGNANIALTGLTVNSSDAIFAKFGGYVNNFNVAGSTITLSAADNIAFNLSGANDMNSVTVSSSVIYADTLVLGGPANTSFLAQYSTLNGSVSGANMNLNNSVWNIPSAGSSVNSLTADASYINLAASASPSYISLIVNGDYLASNDATLIMRAALQNGGGADTLQLLSNALGNTILQVINNNGTGGETTGDGIMLVSGTSDSDAATFELKGNKLDHAGYEYYLYKGGAEEGVNGYNWYLRTQTEDPDPGNPDPPGPVYTDVFRTIANIPALSLSMAKTGMNSLNKRLGDLRALNNFDNIRGAWARTYAKDMTVSDLIDTDLTMFGIEAGYDMLINQDEADQFVVGLMGGYLYNSDTKTKQRNGRHSEGDGYAPSAGVYGSWIHESGVFMDIAVRYFWTTFDMTNYAADDTKITYKPKRDIISASVEFGKDFKFGSSSGSYLRLTPKAEVIYAYAENNKAASSSGFNLKYDNANYVTGRISLLMGFALRRANGLLFEPVLEAAYNYEFNGKSDVEYGGATYKTDLTGGSFEGTAGVNMHFSKNVYLYLQGSYEKGANIKAYGGNLGVRVGFGGGNYTYMKPF